MWRRRLVTTSRRLLGATAAPPPRPPPPPRLPPLRHRVFDWFKDELVPRWRRRTLLFTGGTLLVGGAAAYHVWRHSSAPAVTDAMVAVFEDGGRPGWQGVDQVDVLVPRPELIAHLQEIVRPANKFSQYAVVVGENGTGKSTAVRAAVAGLPSPRGAVYFHAPEIPQSFSADLAQTIGFVSEVADVEGGMRRYVSGITKQEAPPQPADEPIGTWMPLKKALMQAATQYLAKHDRAMVLVIDGADLIAKENPRFLTTLQNFAKQCADVGLLRVVFVTSEGATLPLLAASSAWSRVKVFEVTDIPDEQAIEYLVKRGVPRDRATDAVKTITGGRLIMLRNYGNEFATAPSNDVYRHQLDVKTSRILAVAGIPPDHILFQNLQQHCVIDNDAAIKMLPPDKVTYLLDNNILAAHPDETYTFHSRHVQVFFERQRRTDASV